MKPDYSAIQIRPATHDDVDEIFDVRTSVRQNHATTEALAALGITPGSVREMLASSSRAWVAAERDRIVGFVMADIAQAYVFAMFMRPSHEGRGIGRRLMEAVEGWLFGEGCEEIWLLTDPAPHIRANGFYRRLGWRPDGIQEDGQIRYVKRARVDPGA